MYIEEHNHCFMHYFGVKTLSETLFSPPLKKPGYGTRHDKALATIRQDTAAFIASVAPQLNSWQCAAAHVVTESARAHSYFLYRRHVKFGC